MSNKPNFIFCIPDSYRGDVLRHQGNPRALTPKPDAIAANSGVAYSNAFAQNPVCPPSRCACMTGWYPHVHGQRSMRNMLKEHEPNLLPGLCREVCHVWWGGKNELVRVCRPAQYLPYCDEKFDAAGRHMEHMHYHQPEPLPADDPRPGAYYKGVMRRG